MINNVNNRTEYWQNGAGRNDATQEQSVLADSTLGYVNTQGREENNTVNPVT